MKSGWVLALAVWLIAAHSAHAEPATFDSALEAILARDPQIQVSVATRDATVGQNLYTRYHLLPSISLEASKGRYGPDRYEVSELAARARWNLFRFGADQAGLNAARSFESAATAEIDRTTLDREAYAVRTLVEYIQLSQQNDVLQELEKLQLDSVGVARREYRAGKIALQEVQKVEIDLENVRSRIGESALKYQSAKSALIQLLGHADVQTTWPWKSVIENKKIESAWSAADYYPSRPDYLVTQETLKGQDQTASRAFRSMLPSLDASFSYGLVQDDRYSQGYERGWSGVLTVSVPIFNRLVDYSNYRYQSALREAALQRHTEVVRRIDADFATLPQRFVDARRTALARENILKISGRLYQDNLTRFKMGRASSNELNIDLNRYLDTQLNAINGWAFAHIAYADLAHLLGKRVLGF